jgi:hypothetical protein
MTKLRRAKVKVRKSFSDKDFKTYREARVFDISNQKGIKAAEKYQWSLYDKYDRIEVKDVGFDRVIITGKSK